MSRPISYQELGKTTGVEFFPKCGAVLILHKPGVSGGVINRPFQLFALCAAMIRADFVAILASRNGLSKTATNAFWGTRIDTIQTAVKKGDAVQLVGFGTFKCRKACSTHGQEPINRCCAEDPCDPGADVDGRCEGHGRGGPKGRQAQGRQVS